MRGKSRNTLLLMENKNTQAHKNKTNRIGSKRYLLWKSVMGELNEKEAGIRQEEGGSYRGAVGNNNTGNDLSYREAREMPFLDECAQRESPKWE